MLSGMAKTLPNMNLLECMNVSKDFMDWANEISTIHSMDIIGACKHRQTHPVWYTPHTSQYIYTVCVCMCLGWETIDYETSLSRKFASLSSILFNHKSLKQISFSANTINIYEFELRFIVKLKCGAWSSGTVGWWSKMLKVLKLWHSYRKMDGKWWLNINTVQMVCVVYQIVDYW